MKTVVVLGAGNSGLFASILLKKFRPGINIMCIGSPEIGIVGVGESSTEHFNSFRKLLKLSHKEIVQKCNATFKYGVHFENWNGSDYIHALLGQNVSMQHYDDDYSLYGVLADGEPAVNTIPKNFREPHIKIDVSDGLPNQFHFDTAKLNEFLREQCKEVGVILFDDTIDEITYHDNGNVKSVISNKSENEYEGDLFVDASGFKRILVNEIKEFNFISKQDELFVNSAIAFQCPHEGDNYRCFTTAKKMNAGWMWRIPTYTRMGNGYAYNDKFITEEEAIKEIEEKLGFTPNIGRRFKFEAGYYENTWQRNVVAIGLSSHFFEPLEATAIGIGLLQAKLLSDYLQADKQKDSYNSKIRDLMKNVYNFIRLHYCNCNADTPFWEHVSQSVLPAEVQKIIDIAQERMIVSEDINCNNDWNMFTPHSYNQVLYALGYLKPEKAREHMDLLRKYEDWQVKKEYALKRQDHVINTCLPHKAQIEEWMNDTTPTQTDNVVIGTK
tara:strand:- start:8705 stop:10198 length:1494 start_codon:yes stop_codon:yes gene_type:complete